MSNPTTSSNRLLAYGSLACGATALLSGNAEAATIINVNASSYDTGLSNLGTISSSSKGPYGYLRFSGTGVSQVTGLANGQIDQASSTQTVTPNTEVSLNSFLVISYGSGASGALSNSSDNWFYAFGAADNSQRMWIQFQLGTQAGSGFSVVKVVIPDFAGELPSASHAASAVPETSSLALLSLGAVGLLKRRRRAA